MDSNLSESNQSDSTKEQSNSPEIISTDKIGNENPQNGNGEKKEESKPKESSISQSQQQSSTNSNQQIKDPEELIKAKVLKIRKNYNFSMSYSLGILNILKLFHGLLFEKVFNSLNENKNILNFFKEISSFYQGFADQLKKTNKNFSSQPQLPKIFDDGLKIMLEKTQNDLSKNFIDLASSLRTKILAKEPMNRVEELYNSIEIIRKEIFKKIEKLERRRKKLEKLYKNKYELLFNDFCPITSTNPQNQGNIILEDTTDFVIVELDLSNSINKMFLKTNLYLTEMKDYIYTMNRLVIEYSKLMRDALMIYIQESKKMYTSDITQNFTQVEQYYETMSKPGADQSFKIEKIFQTAELQAKMDEQLKLYQRLIVDSKLVTNDILFYDNRFMISYYSNIELFFEMLIEINPKPTPLSYSDLVFGVYAIKRDPGVFSSWRNCVLMFTKQKHAIIFDEPVNKNFVTIFELTKITYRPKPDKKNNNLFEIVVNRKGKIMNSSGTYLYDAKSDEILKEIAFKFTSSNPLPKEAEQKNQ